MMTDPHSLKGQGYLISIASVFLLAFPPLKSSKGDPIVIAMVLVGALLSIVGMGFRWIADRKTQRRIDDAQDEEPGQGQRQGSRMATGH